MLPGHPVGQTRVCGSDRIVQKEGRLLVYTTVEMPDWYVSNYRRNAVVVDEQTYFIAIKENFDRRTIRYTLEPWSESSTDMPGKTIHYNEEYVRTRDLAIKDLRQRELIFWFLRFLKPLIGLLPSGLKIRIEAQYGISPRTATFFSLWLELIAFFAAGTVVLIASFGGLRSEAVLADSLFGSLPVLIPFTLFLLFEAAVRYSSYLSHTHSPYGFCEWIFHRHR